MVKRISNIGEDQRSSSVSDEITFDIWHQPLNKSENELQKDDNSPERGEPVVLLRP